MQSPQFLDSMFKSRIMNHWLAKTEPDTYSWSDLVKQKEGTWDGVRNAEARNNMKAMKAGDLVFIYHTGKEKAIVGIAEVSIESFPEPTDDSPWVAVKLKPLKALAKPFTLEDAKADRKLSNMSLIRMSRLSVQPVTPSEFRHILKCTSTQG